MTGARKDLAGPGPGEGLYTDMHAIRKDYFLDYDHSAFFDQWDWE